MSFKKHLILLLAITVVWGCQEEPKVSNESAQIASGENKKEEPLEQLNITILLDLSDRIEPTKYPNSPEHFERDLEIVKYYTELFKQDMEALGAYMAKGKIKVIFNPRPEDNEINKIASELNVDLSKASNTKEKKIIYDNITQNFQENLSRIYKKTIDSKNYIGSDIWRFFKNDVKDYAITTDPGYRNILVIVTDGYMYHSDSKDIQGNRSAYLLPKTIQTNGLRSSNWNEKFDSGDYGFITKRNDLEDLEVILLEVNPSKVDKDDEDVIRAYFSKWFTEMGVQNFEIYNTDLPEYTKSRIEKFMINV